MWVFSTAGFFSITVSSDDPTKMQVRARERVDLENFIAAAEVDGAEIIETPRADYQFRVILEPADAVNGIAILAAQIDYTNFKGAVAATPSQRHKEHGLHDIWAVHRRWQGRWRPDRGIPFPRPVDPPVETYETGNLPLEPCDKCGHARKSHNRWRGACLEHDGSAGNFCTCNRYRRKALTNDSEPCGTCGHPRTRHMNRRGACSVGSVALGHRSFCTCSCWKRCVAEPNPPTMCGRCEYAEEDGSLVEQCPNCRAADAGAEAAPLHNPLERKRGPKSRARLAAVIDNVPKITHAQAAMLRSIRDHGDGGFHIRGNSMAGGSGATMTVIRRLGLALFAQTAQGRDVITDAGTAALRKYEGK